MERTNSKQIDPPLPGLDCSSGWDCNGFVVERWQQTFDEKAGLGQRAKPVLVEAVIAAGAVEALDEGVLNGFTTLDVMKVTAER